ncbi:MAG: hypothetical protein FP819_03650 [Rhizobiaceae bacterium]|nr:hypothetical protein [Rhizobiaceae bacterium]
MKTYFYVDSPAGSGKTHSLSHFAVDEAKAHRKIAICQPTKRLLKQTLKAIRGIDGTIKVTAIFTQGRQTSAIPRIVEHLSNATPHTGEVLLISHESLRRLPGGNRKFWSLVVDEIPGVFVHLPLRIRYTHDLVTQHLGTEELIPGIAVLSAAHPQRVDDLISQAKDDQNIETFLPLLSAVRDEKQLVCAETSRWTELLTGEALKRQSDFFLVQTPDYLDGFSDVTLMGANATCSELVVLWQRLFEIEFKPHPSLSELLRYHRHENGHRLTLHYCFDRWSKTYSQSTTPETGEDTVLEHLNVQIANFFDTSPFLWQANKDVEDDFFEDAKRLPHVPHGLDEPDYMKVHNVALLSAVNRETPAFKFLGALGLDDDTITATLAYQNDYQAMMRCSLRDPDATQPVNVLVMTQGSAEWIGKRFAGCTIKAFDTGLSGPRKRGGRHIETPKKSRAEIQKAYRDRRKVAAGHQGSTPAG